MKKIFKLLDKISKDKWQHSSLGALIAAIIFCVCVWCGLQFAVATFISIAGLWLIELGKEFFLDSKADWKDIVATMLGGLMVWLPLCVTHSHL